MNLMWAYFHLRPELISMFVMNNDLQVSPFDTFTRFNRCIQSIQVCHWGLPPVVCARRPCHCGCNCFCSIAV